MTLCEACGNPLRRDDTGEERCMDCEAPGWRSHLAKAREALARKPEEPKSLPERKAP